jgi:predicted SprT family Zn-dependent metalloprotease
MIDLFEANDILEEANISFSEYNLQAKFDEFNQKYFGNKLPKVPLGWERTTRRTGVCTYYVRDGIIKDIEIKLSKAFKRPEEHFDKVLVHEMVHLWNNVDYPNYREHTRLFGKDGHGHMFMERIAKLSKITGWDIPVKDDMTDVEEDSVKAKNIDYMLLKKKETEYSKEEWLVGVYKRGVLTDRLEDAKEVAKHMFWRFDEVYVGKSNHIDFTTQYRTQMKFFNTKNFKFYSTDKVDHMREELVEMAVRIK